LQRAYNATNFVYNSAEKEVSKKGRRTQRLR